MMDEPSRWEPACRSKVPSNKPVRGQQLPGCKNNQHPKEKPHRLPDAAFFIGKDPGSVRVLFSRPGEILSAGADVLAQTLHGTAGRETGGDDGKK